MKKEYYENKINNSKKLPDLFKELQDIKSGKVPPQIMEVEPKKEQIKFNRITVADHKFNFAGAIIGILFIILFFSSINSNYILATTEKKKIAIAEFESNNNALDMDEIVSNNINEVTKKEIVTEELEINFETSYVENGQLPKDEQIILCEGKKGKNKITKIRTYEKNELVNENVISIIMEESPVNEVIEVGTSENLKNIQAHIGDTIYTKQDTILYDKPEDLIENEICMIYGEIDVKLENDEGEWIKINIDGIEGYVKPDSLTSENITPGIKEKSRIKRIMLELNPDMELNKPSGLTKEDFIKIFSNNSSDTNKIFEENAELFYELEEKYNINAIFIASVGILESNWGRSVISLEKKNLFGYGSYDSDPYNSSYTFESYQEGIETMAKVFSKYYINPRGTIIYEEEIAQGTYYNGPTLKGINIRYASDEEWANKVYGVMTRLYEKLY